MIDSDRDSPISLPSTRKRRNPSALSDSEDEQLEACSLPCLESAPVKKKKRTITKSEEDNIPLPYPFPLPKFYGAEIDAALKSKKMTMGARQGFVSKVASAMLCYKRYPSTDDYTNVSYVITQAYPFMKAPVGAPGVSFT